MAIRQRSDYLQNDIMKVKEYERMDKPIYSIPIRINKQLWSVSLLSKVYVKDAGNSEVPEYLDSHCSFSSIQHVFSVCLFVFNSVMF